MEPVPSCVTHPEFLRQGRLLGDKVGLVRIDDPFAPLEVHSAQDAKLLKLIRGEVSR